MTNATTPTTERNADLQALVTRLQDDQQRKHDVVTAAANLKVQDRRLHVANAWTELSADGVTTGDLTLDMGDVMLGQMATRLGVPVKYVRRMHDEGAEDEGIAALFDANANTWLERDTRTWMVRSYGPTEGGVGFGRALLSDRYRIIDNLDVLTAALDGLRSTGIQSKVVGCDLSEQRMRVRVQSDAVSALAPELLAGYRSPYGGAEGTANPVVFGGFEISNGETGGGRFTIVPRLVVQVCSNGLRINKDAVAQTHLGGQLDEGIIQWSDQTQQASLDLVRSQTADTVRTIMDVDYMRKVIADLRDQAQVPVTNVENTTNVLTKQLRWSDAERAGILGDFIQGGQMQASGFLHATTSYAQRVADPERAAELEDHGLMAMAAAAKVG